MQFSHQKNFPFRFVIDIDVEFVSEDFMVKIDTALFLINEGLLPNNYRKLDVFHNKIGKYGLCFLAKISYLVFHQLMEFQLKSKHPSLRLFDWYRYGYYCLKK